MTVDETSNHLINDFQKNIRDGFKNNSKIWGFCPKRREGVISETQFLHTFKLGLLSEEGGG